MIADVLRQAVHRAQVVERSVRLLVHQLSEGGGISERILPLRSALPLSGALT